MLIKVFIFILGSIIGSFLNVCIYRLPREESVIYPPSHCVHCNNRIYWYDNIPFFSYLFLRGRCRFCGRPISPTYFLVEFLTAILWLLLFISFGLSARFFLMGALGSALIAAAAIDLAFRIIPDSITLGGLIIGVMASFLFPSAIGEITHKNAFLNSILGALAGGGSIYITGILGRMAFKKEAMGGGDMKLLAMIGAFLGWKRVLAVFFIAPFFGAPAGIILKLKYKIDTIPYGPYLSLAAFIVMFWGEEILSRIFL